MWSFAAGSPEDAGTFCHDTRCRYVERGYISLARITPDVIVNLETSHCGSAVGAATDKSASNRVQMGMNFVSYDVERKSI